MVTQVATQPSLFQQLGGRDAIATVVDNFYARILADAELAPFFAGRDIDRQRRHQAAFLAFALGGPNEYRGRSMRRAHAGLGITAHHFGLVAGHLVAALGDCDVPGELIADIAGRVARCKETWSRSDPARPAACAMGHRTWARYQR